MAGTRWARLTWQAGHPRALAEELARRLGVEPEPVEGGAWRFGLGGEALDVVPWRREGAGDNPAAEGRLMFEPIDGGGDPPDPDPFAPLCLVGVAWSTVELDRAEAEMDPWLYPSDAALGDGDAEDDPHLGARTRLRRSASLPGDTLVLAEPGTEGRLAGSLARDGEGPCALYLRPAEGLDVWVPAARDRGVRVSARRLGPLGRAVLLPGRGIAGPHLLIVDAPAAATRASTIAP
ncbi:MAG TPA: hypothetical protein VIR16_00960 [Candidatus Limnocylindrales bacterium]